MSVYEALQTGADKFMRRLKWRAACFYCEDRIIQRYAIASRCLLWRTCRFV